jgi:hypothetical protein
MPLGDTPLILGMTWLKEANPHINWETLSVQYQDDTVSPNVNQVAPVIARSVEQ